MQHKNKHKNKMQPRFGEFGVRVKTRQHVSCRGKEMMGFPIVFNLRKNALKASVIRE